MARNHGPTSSKKAGKFRVVIGCEWDISERKKSIIKTVFIGIATSTISGLLVKIIYGLYQTGGTHGIPWLFT